MSATLTIQIDEKVLAVIAAKAAESGVTPDQVAADFLARRFAPPILGPARTPGALNRFIGCVSVDDPRGSDNMRIDEDLAAEYGRGGPPPRSE